MEDWLKHTAFFKQFDWITLEKVPEWKDIDTTARTLIQEGFFERESHQALFHCFDVLKQYLTDDVILKHKTDKKNFKTIVQRWDHFFKHATEDVTPLATIVAYILTLPGMK